VGVRRMLPVMHFCHGIQQAEIAGLFYKTRVGSLA
jgi:hypothetical protein